MALNHVLRGGIFYQSALNFCSRQSSVNDGGNTEVVLSTAVSYAHDATTSSLVASLFVERKIDSPMITQSLLEVLQETCVKKITLPFFFLCP
jgi:hypothetical protein